MMSGFNGLNSASTVYQMIDGDGKPSRAVHTLPLWVDHTCTNVFSSPTQGNKVESFVTGKDYFADLIAVCDQAKSEIYIAGWQVNWDALLAPGVRLYDLLLRCVKRGVKVYIMPWDDSEPVQTYDDQTKIVLENINNIVAAKNGKGSISVTLCPSFASVNNAYFSHHQKQVVIDREIAYVGGIDLAYGRMDDATYNLKANADGREVLNQYNPGIPPLRNLDSKSRLLVDPDLMSGSLDKFHVNYPWNGKPAYRSSASEEEAKIASGGWQVRYGKASAIGVGMNNGNMAGDWKQYTALDPARQPRMPWNDVHCKIQGPAVSDLLRNFVLRWNAISKNKLPPPKAAAQYPSVGKASIQVLRSAPAAHCSKELKASSVTGRIGTQQDIHVAMQNLIAKATRFIYIENQFFVSDFGAIGGGQNELSPAAAYIKNGADGISDSTLWIVRSAADGARNDPALDRLPQNKILPALLARLRQVILDDASKPKFHIYITLPVHPEGAVIDPTIAVQVYYTMQTLVFGSHSLMKGIKRLLKARELKDKKEKSYLDVWENISNNSFESISDEACFEYVTLLNLRNWAKIGTAYITEQIYVHSKLMIVDDRFALMGSANINDRSLLGERDSELAVLIMDEDTVRADINGKGSNQPVRAFAHELRKKIWNKIFGVTSGERSALDLKIAVEEPGHPESWRKIRDRAEKNTDLYDKAFPFIPRNKSPNAQLAKQSASILPTWDPNLKEIGKKTVGGLASPMPFQEEFWNKIRNTDDAKNLTSIRGYITALPVEWTKGENIAIKYPTAIIVKNDGDAPLVDPQVSEVVLASSDRPSKIESEQQG